MFKLVLRFVALSFVLISTPPGLAPAFGRQPTAAHSGNGVVSAADPRATAAGAEILKKGGSAIDAEMAMMLALTVVEPQSSGIGGGGFLVHHGGASGLIETVDGREKAPMAADENRFLGADGKPMPFMQAFPGGKSVGVPGNIRLMAMAHDKWGKLDWAELFQPAIRLAENGFKVDKALYGRLELLAPLWKDFPEAQAIYWIDGKPAPLGTTIRNPQLAALLRTIARRGPDAFYSGENAEALVQTVAGASVNPSDMTMEDLANYAARQRAPVCSPYRMWKICGMGPPSSGGLTVMQILGLLERFDMKALGKDDPTTWHLIGEAMQMAYADRDTYLADTDFVTVPVAGFIDPRYMQQRSKLISKSRSQVEFKPGQPPKSMARTYAKPGERGGTTHFVAVDSDGNIASMTSTIEGPFGSQLVVNGYFLNNELTDFTFAPERDGAVVANRVEGGKRPLSSMSPTIVYDSADKPVLALGSAGGRRIIMHVAKTLIGVLDFGLPVGEAIALPNIFYGNGKLLVEKGTWLEEMAPELQAFGQDVDVRDLPSKVNAAQWNGNEWTGASDPRGEGSVLLP